MEAVQQFEVPEIASEYGEEDYVNVGQIYYDPEFERVTMLVEDADSIDGFYHHMFDASKDPETGRVIVEDDTAVGVPPLVQAVQLDHLTAIEILNETRHINIIV